MPGMNGTADSVRRLTRSCSDRAIGGVAGGLGRYFAVDPVVIRIAFVVLTLTSGIGLALYLACWLLIPEDGAAESVASEYMHRWQDRSR